MPKSSKKFKLDISEVPDFDVFVQSTSVNRVLLPGTEFLYEIEEEEGTVRGGNGRGGEGEGEPICSLVCGLPATLYIHLFTLESDTLRVFMQYVYMYTV